MRCKMNPSTATKSSNSQNPRVVSTNDLPLSCPTNEDKTWNLHPKVYLKFNDAGKASCQYCGAQFTLNNQ